MKSISGKALSISAGQCKTTYCILQHHDFVVEESGAELACLQSKSFTERTFGTSLNKKCVKDDHKLFSCDPWRVFGHSNSPPHRALGRYRHVLFQANFFTSLVDWNLLIIPLDFQCFNYFLTATFYFVMLSNLVLHIRTTFLGFTFDGWLREFGHCVLHIYNPVEQEVMAGQYHASSHPGVLRNLNMNGDILQRYFAHKNL